MELGNVILTPTMAVAGVAGLGLAGLVVWWLVRKRQQRVWLPTVRIMRLESRILPKLVLRPPPVVPFLCFLIAALVLLGFAMRPRTQVFTPFEPNQTRILIFADMSPSVAAHVSVDEYAQKMSALYTSLKGTGRISIATSHEPKTTEPQSAEEVAQLIKTSGFHRAGLRLGSALKALLEESSEVDRLFIVSDRDQHGWTGFNWRYLLDEMDVVFYDLSGAAGESLKNVFVNDARFLSTPASPTMDWDVEVARRTAAGGEVEGKLEAVYMGKTLGTFPWKLPAGKQRISVRAEWPATSVPDAGPGSVHEIPLVFRIEVDGGTANDALAMDNEFRTELLGMKQDVLVVSESAGERLLEDPAEQLEVALDIQGFRLRRYDYIAQPGPSPDEFPFIVLLGGADGGVDRFCPKSLEAARLAAHPPAGKEHGARDAHRRPLPKVWLAPQTLNANWRDLCRCYSRLLLTSGPNEAEPAYCAHVEARSQWAGLLPSLGAKQVGGQLGDASKTLAWHATDRASGLEVLAFTVPLAPSVATGLTHAEMPVLVKELLTWQGLLESRGAAAASWPRIEDLVARTWKPATPLEPTELARIRLSNVPLGESLLSEIDETLLPPRWTAPADWSTKVLPAKKDREDPLPWLKLAAWVVVAVTGLEAAWTLLAKLLRFLARRPEAAGVALLIGTAAALTAWAPKAEARVELDLVGYHETMTMATLAREVAHRTSIEMETKPNGFAQLTPEALGEPWLWIRDLAMVTGPGGALRPDVVMWIKRGGFLVIEAPAVPAQLAGLTTGIKGTDPNDGIWQPLPPDHELMRSFYLLDALPSCNGEIWRGFEYDGRLAILALPYSFLATVKDHAAAPPCQAAPDQERAIRVFVNLVMVALATDYKKDQIHLPEILKRLR